ncbi:MAG: histone deacetylase family protein [Natronospirillum sp.]|uniref:histone deacetylase family protein n=1 Tax=Natronospirillum sp. TaxID=2812955 RepID=UPI0025E32428|nr:histone deacetylase family protein [Natronospirillum sp.]MCH8551186.1 histone deacetylase family protein [Natronospirillum sp.]
MTTGFIHHPASLLHDMGDDHPESPARLQAILDRLKSSGVWQKLDVYLAPMAEDRHLLTVHLPRYLEQVRRLAPKHGLVHAGPDTLMGPHSLEAALRSAGSGIQAVDGIMTHLYQNAFCATRPPGHHAEPGTTMGFCFFHNVAVAARYLQREYGVRRLAIIDFDVHQGNGTAEVFRGDPDVLFISSFQHPFYPHSHWQADRSNLLYSPLPAYSGGELLRQIWTDDWQPALREHSPEFILLSAGFDAHREDPLAELEWTTDDYRWLTREIMTEAQTGGARGRVISFLEGGYNTHALADSVQAHIEELVVAGHPEY